jgi:hypothetical protein
MWEKMVADVKRCMGKWWNVGAGIAWAIVIVGGLYLFILGLLWFIDMVDEGECASIGKETGMPVKYVGSHWYTRECYVNDDERWIPLDHWRTYDYGRP